MQILLLIIFIVTSVVAQDVRNIEKPLFGGAGVGLGATVNAVSIDSVYSKTLQYNYQYMLFAGLEDIEENLYDRVDWEFHVGIGAYEPKQMYKVGFLGCKMNFNNGKIVGAKSLQAKINKLRNYHSLSGLRSPLHDTIQKRLNDFQQEVNQYQSQFWYKRIGMAFWVPMYGEYDASYERIRTGNDITSSNLSSGSIVSDSVDTATRNESFQAGTSRFLFQDFSKSAVSLTYDLGDLLTLSLGANLQRKIFLGISVDVSTPISDFSASFRNELRTLRTPSTANIGN